MNYPTSSISPLPFLHYIAQASGFCPKPLLCCDHRNNPKDDPAEDSTDDTKDDRVNDLAYHSTDNLGDDLADDLAAAFVDNPTDDFGEDPVGNPTEKYPDHQVDHLADYLTGDPAENYMDDLVNNSENGNPGDKVSDPLVSDSGPAHAPFPEGRSDVRPGVPDSFTVPPSCLSLPKSACIQPIVFRFHLLDTLGVFSICSSFLLQEWYIVVFKMSLKESGWTVPWSKCD